MKAVMKFKEFDKMFNPTNGEELIEALVLQKDNTKFVRCDWIIRELNFIKDKLTYFRKDELPSQDEAIEDIIEKLQSEPSETKR